MSGKNLTQKILSAHLIEGKLEPKSPIAIRIDQTLTQDSTGTMAYLQFEALGLPRVRTKFSIAYVDHNMLQSGFENADDHKYLQTVAAHFGVRFSRPGNGVCHQVHLERFAKPGETLLGSDSHTPTAGALGMIAIGAGGLDVAVAMGGEPYHLATPKVLQVYLTGALRPWVTAKDVILEVLRRLSVKGGVGKILEYTGPGIASLSVPERATICNMGAELGATCSIFPADEETKRFMQAQDRAEDFQYFLPDEDAVYDERIEIDLSKLNPMIACPHMPDNVMEISEIEGDPELEGSGIPVDQVVIGSCTNSSYMDMMKVAAILKGQKVHESVSLVIAPGSRQVLNMLAENGALGDMIMAGARLIETGCGPCIGMGQSPRSNAISLRTINRNFYGRSGTSSAEVYLVSPETGAVSAIKGYLTDPRHFGEAPICEMPEEFLVNDNMVIQPPEDGSSVEIVRGPNIKPFPLNKALKDTLSGTVLIKVEDNITTDHIMPSNAKLLPFRSNIPYLAEYCLTPCDPDFPKRAQERQGGIIVAGANYGQGSSREHAALAPVALGVRAVLAQSFARIHEANLINNGILPIVFNNPEDYNSIDRDDLLILESARDAVKNSVNGDFCTVKNETKNQSYSCRMVLSPRQAEMLLAGGLLNSMKAKREAVQNE